MKPQELVDLLRDFYVDKLALKRRHEDGARAVGTYDFNNTYQYVIYREEAHLDWLRRAVTGTGGTVPDEVQVPPVPGTGRSAEASVIADDVQLMEKYIEKWRDRIERVDDSRQKLMLRVIVGEMLEQKRFFEQAAAGRHDLLGRRTSPSEASGTVMPTRWVE